MLDATNGAKVLLVEDELMIRMATADMLIDSGFGVTEAETGAEALAQIINRGVRFDAVVLDLGLPDRAGGDVVGDLRRLRRDLPIVITSGQSQSALAAVFGSDSAIRIVSKPYHHGDLLLALNQLGVGPAGSVEGTATGLDPHRTLTGA